MPTPTEPQRLDRRAFLRLCAAAAAAGAAAPLLAGCAPPPADRPRSAGQRFLADAGRALGGPTLRLAVEPSPLARALAGLAAAEFTPLSGVGLAWEFLPGPQLLAASHAEAADASGAHDLYDWDQAWLGGLAPHAADLRELEARAGLAYPGYAPADLLPELVQQLAADGDRLIGLPFDVPLLLLCYRRDLFAQLGLEPPASPAQFRAAARAIDGAGLPGVRGALGQWAAGHYALQCDFSAWLWAHGGSFFAADGRPALADDAGRAALDHMAELRALAPPAAATWDWWDAGAAFARGEAGMAIFWNVFAPAFDDPASPVAGKVGLAPVPIAAPARPASACGFGERPGAAHQGGSVLAISRHSRQPEAAWLFLQWAGSAEVINRAARLSGATPVRASGYGAPDAPAHYAATRAAITGQLGGEPRLPAWPFLAVDGLARELGRGLAGRQSEAATLERMGRALAAGAAL